MSRRAVRSVVAVALLLALVGAGAYAGIRLRWFRPPFPPLGRELAWLVGDPEAGYNFGAVVPGHVYRSGRLDARFVRYLRAERGVERIVALDGALPEHALARELGIDVITYDWPASEAPPEDELRQVIAALEAEGPVLVHCAAGADRTGVAVAAFRVRSQGWSVDRALAEMERYWVGAGRDAAEAVLRREAAERPAAGADGPG